MRLEPALPPLRRASRICLVARRAGPDPPWMKPTRGPAEPMRPCFMLVGHEDRDYCRGQDVSCRSAKDEFPELRVAISPHDEEIRSDIGDVRQQNSSNVGAHKDACLCPYSMHSKMADHSNLLRFDISFARGRDTHDPNGSGSPKDR